MPPELALAGSLTDVGLFWEFAVAFAVKLF